MRYYIFFLMFSCDRDLLWAQQNNITAFSWTLYNISRNNKNSFLTTLQENFIPCECFWCISWCMSLLLECVWHLCGCCQSLSYFSVNELKQMQSSTMLRHYIFAPSRTCSRAAYTEEVVITRKQLLLYWENEVVIMRRQLLLCRDNEKTRKKKNVIMHGLLGFL